MAADWQEDLDAVLGSVERLDKSLRGLPRAEAGAIARRLRGANSRLWRYINELEAHHVEHLYDIHAMVRAMAERIDPFDIPELWITLNESGALKMNPKAIIEQARKVGVNPDDYREEE